MDYLAVIVLAAVQGITEFLPISSDGHLVVAESLLRDLAGSKIPEGLQFTIVLHAGTLLSIVVVFWSRIRALLGADRRVIGLMVVGTLPVVATGFALHKYEELLKSPILTGIFLMLNGLMLLWAARQVPGQTGYENLSCGRALLIGLAQAVAPLPGISRSGTTIAAGLTVGLRRDAAATFSFLLALPAVGGACCYELLSFIRGGEESVLPWQQLAVGAACSFVVGVIALRWLLRWLQAGRLHWFGWWCIALGLGVFVWRMCV